MDCNSNHCFQLLEDQIKWLVKIEQYATKYWVHSSCYCTKDNISVLNTVELSVFTSGYHGDLKQQPSKIGSHNLKVDRKTLAI